MVGGGKRGQNAVRMVQQITSSKCDSEIINLSSIMLGKQRGQRRAGAHSGGAYFGKMGTGESRVLTHHHDEGSCLKGIF